MLISEISTELCKSVEIFVYTEFTLDLSTLFSERAVEKPVENVENSCVKSVSPGLQY